MSNENDESFVASCDRDLGYEQSDSLLENICRNNISQNEQFGDDICDTFDNIELIDGVTVEDLYELDMEDMKKLIGNTNEIDGSMNSIPSASPEMDFSLSMQNINTCIYSKEVEDDSDLYCYECNDSFIDGCTIHPVIWVSNIPIKSSFIPKWIDVHCNSYFKNKQICIGKRLVIGHIWRTMPDILAVGESKIEDVELGIWTKSAIRKGATFGPYVGVIRFIDEITNRAIFENLQYNNSWLVRKNISGTKAHIIDAADGMKGNWLRYVNCARNEEEQNLVAVQFKGCIFYRAFRDIKCGEELMMHYNQSHKYQSKADSTDEMEYSIYNWISENPSITNSMIKSKLEAKFPHKQKVAVNEIFRSVNRSPFGKTLPIKPNWKMKQCEPLTEEILAKLQFSGTRISREMGVFIARMCMKNCNVLLLDIRAGLFKTFGKKGDLCETFISKFINRNRLRSKCEIHAKLDDEMKAAILQLKTANPTMTNAMINKKLETHFLQKPKVKPGCIGQFLGNNRCSLIWN